ncbi:hypothetical protein D3C84_949360 [compost metagenome]
MPSELLRALGPPLLAALCSLLTRHDGQTAVKVCSTTTLNIALAEQRCNVTRRLSQTQLVTSQQEMSNPWMTRQLCHSLPMLCQLPIWLQRAKAPKQIARLGVCTCGRSIKPLQVTGLHAPLRQLES